MVFSIFANSELYSPTDKSVYNPVNTVWFLFYKYEDRFTIELDHYYLSKTQNNFLQIVFMGNMEEQLDRRLGTYAGMKRTIFQDLQCLLYEHHALVRLFKSALERMPSDDYKVVIKADKWPSGTHERTFNAPTVDEVAILIVGKQLEKRDIVLTRRNTGQL